MKKNKNDQIWLFRGWSNFDDLQKLFWMFSLYDTKEGHLVIFFFRNLKKKSYNLSSRCKNLGVIEILVRKYHEKSVNFLKILYFLQIISNKKKQDFGTYGRVIPLINV